jgi:hypothetical protein
VSKYEHQLQPEKNYEPKKKVKSSGRLCFSNHRNKLRPKKKRYSRLTDRWNKSQITICHVKTQTHKLGLKKIMTGNKVRYSSVISKYEHHQSHFNWHDSSCWLLCLCVLCFVFCAPTDNQTTAPFFSGRNFFQFCNNTTDGYLRFISTVGQMTVPFFSARNFFRL